MPGYLQSPRAMIWSRRKHRLTFLPNQSYGDVLVKKGNGLGAYKEALYCPGCGMMVLRSIADESS